MDPSTPESGAQPPTTPGAQGINSPRVTTPATTPAQVSQRPASGIQGQVPPPPGQPRNLQATRPNVSRTQVFTPPQPKMGRRIMQYDGSYVLYCGGTPKCSNLKHISSNEL